MAYFDLIIDLVPLMSASHSPHLCVGFLFLILYHPAPPPSPPLSPTIFDTPAFAHNLVTHHLSHTTLSHTIFHTPSFTRHPWQAIFHITLSHTIFHTPSFTHHLWHTIFVTHHLSHTIFHTPLCHTPSLTHHLSHTTLSHTIFDTPLSHTIFHPPSFTHNFVTHHLWHTTLPHTTLSHTIFHTTLSHTIFDTPSFTQLCHTPSFTPLCHTPSFTHHLWHTPSFTHTIFHTPLCRPPSLTHHLSHTTFSHTIFHPPSLTHHLSHTALSPTIFDTPSFTPLCHTPSFTPLCHTPSFTHHLWHTPSFTHTHTIFHTRLCLPPPLTHHLSHTTLSPTIFDTPSLTHHLSHIFVLRCRRGTWWHPPWFHVAGVALRDIYLRLAWQVWHLLHLVARLVARARRATLRARCGTWWHPPSFYVAGMALGDIYLRLKWQAWHLLHLVACLVAARRAAPLCVAGVALCDIRLRFTWQAWHLETSTFVLHGRRGAWWHPPSFHVAAAALVALGVALGWRAAPLCVAGIALGDIHLHFAWQVWHLVTSTFVLRGRCGTWWHPPSFCVAGVALGDIHLRFAWQVWQVWQLVTSTIFHTPSFTHHLSHTSLPPTIFDTPSFTHHFVAHHLSPTIFHTQLCHTPSLTHHFVAHHLSPHHFSYTTLSHTIFHHTIFHRQLTLSHTIFRHTIFHTPLCHTPFFTHNFVTRSLSHLTFTDNFVTHTHTIFLCHPPSSPSPLQHLVLIIGRSRLVGLSGPFIFWGVAGHQNIAVGHHVPAHDAVIWRLNRCNKPTGNIPWILDQGTSWVWTSPARTGHGFEDRWAWVIFRCPGSGSLEGKKITGVAYKFPLKPQFWQLGLHIISKSSKDLPTKCCKNWGTVSTSFLPDFSWELLMLPSKWIRNPRQTKQQTVSEWIHFKTLTCKIPQSCSARNMDFPYFPLPDWPKSVCISLWWSRRCTG